MKARLPRLLTIAGLAGLCVPIIASGIDRINFSQRPAIVLPRPLAGPETLRQEALAAAVRGDSGTADDLAERAVRGAPAVARFPSLLGTLALQRHDAHAAGRAFLVAGQLGWRDIATQSFLTARAYAVGDIRVTVERTDALLRTGSAYGTLEPLIRATEASPDGPVLLAERLAQSPEWADEYVVHAGALAPALFALRVATLSAARRGGMLVRCQPVEHVAEQLVPRARAAEALALWQRLGCGDAGPTNLDAATGGFEADEAEMPGLVLFAWSLKSNGDAVARRDAAPGGASGQSLYVSGQGLNEVVVADRIILLPPGVHRLSWRSLGGGRLPVTLSLMCSRGGRIVSGDARAMSGNRFEVDVTVPAGCVSQHLRVVVAPGNDPGAEAWIDDIAVTERIG